MTQIDERFVTELKGKDLARFMSHVSPGPAGCWLWDTAGRNGYGSFSLGRSRRGLYSHRVSFLFFNGPIPSGHQIHHRCETPRCVNPSHLAALTPKEHSQLLPRERRNNAAARRTHCPAGHPYDAANTYHHPRGDRICRACNRAAQARYSRRQHGTR